MPGQTVLADGYEPMILFDYKFLREAFADLPRNPREYPDVGLDLELHVRLSKDEQDFERKRMPCPLK